MPDVMNSEYFENLLFTLPLITGAIFMLCGVVMLIFPPKKINWFYGYRTTASMKNQERWDFAQKFSALEMVKLGGLLSLCSLLAFITDFSRTTNLTIGFFLLTAIAILLFIRTEKALKQKFNPSS